MNNDCTIASAFFLKDKALLQSLTTNASRLMKSMCKHKKERSDIEQLAAALDYDAPQLETDIEDVIALAAYGRYAVKKRLQQQTANA